MSVRHVSISAQKKWDDKNEKILASYWGKTNAIFPIGTYVFFCRKIRF